MDSLAVVLLLGLTSEIFGPSLADSESLWASTFLWFLAFIPALTFLVFRSVQFNSFPRISGWWPSLGLGFLVAVFQFALIVSTHTE